MAEKKTLKKRRAQADGQKDLIRALLFCIAAVIFVRTFLFEPFKIPSSSMLPTLKVGDHIFVSKFNYSFFIPFTNFGFLNIGRPDRGDVVVFISPRDPSLHYIKRVVGVPGDKIQIKNKSIFINGKEVDRKLVKNPNKVASLLGRKRGLLYEEVLGENRHFVRYSKEGQAENLRLEQEKEIPGDSYFVMGDNRDESYDSRSWGFVPLKNIKGKAQMVWLSLSQDESWSGFEKVRWSRSGTLIK